MEEESWRSNHGGGIMEEESWMRNPGGGIMDEESWMRNPGGIMDEVPRRHPGCTQEATGGTQEAPNSRFGRYLR